MATKLPNFEQKQKQKFRLLDNPNILVLGLLDAPPQDVRYSANLVVLQLKVSLSAYNVRGKVIVNASQSKTRYLCGEFNRLRESLAYRVYELTDYDVTWVRQVKKKHPVHGKETGELTYEELGLINIAVQWDTRPPSKPDNPTQMGYIYSDRELKAGDVVNGVYLIRETRDQFGVFMSRFAYKSVKDPYD